jgi:hypothetical protein
MTEFTGATEAAQRLLGEKTKYGYAEQNIYVDAAPFSFYRHNYLIGLYQDMHRNIVIEKSAQMGASVYALASAFFVTDKLGKNVIYFFPTDTDVQDFAKTRAQPMIDDSPHLKAITNDKDASQLRRVNKAWLYFRGMKSSIAMKSIPADYLIMDELDEISEASETLADQRLNHSDLKWRLKLSTPTFEGYGIDREFKSSDMRYWNLVCRKCNKYNIVEKTFPDCVRQDSDVEAYLVCEKCKEILDSQYGVWVPDAPKVQRVRGYHISGLYSAFLDLSDLMAEYNSGRRREEFFRSKLGIPYTAANQRITVGMVEACRENFEMHVERHTYMGVDQKGDELHIVIRKPNRMTTKHDLVFIGKVTKFEQLDMFMRQYDVDCCVIDGLPNQHSARDFAARFSGRVFLCYYQDTQKNDYSWSEPKSGEDAENWEVKANRTEALDAMYEQVIRRELALPKEVPQEFISQMTQLAKVYEEDDDGAILRALWKRLGPEHYAHATSYSLIAQSRFNQVTNKSSVTVQPPSLGRMQYARRYEMGSRY